MINTFSNNPIRCNIYDPITKTILSTTVSLGNVPRAVMNAVEDMESPTSVKILKAYYGDKWQKTLRISGGDDDDIEDLLANTTVIKKADTNSRGTLHHSGLHYIQYPAFYPEDKWREVKDKIYLITGIPTYRQHLFYSAHGVNYTTYKLYSNGIRSTDITDFHVTEQSLFGVPIDRDIYNARNNIRVESLEEFQLLGDSLQDNTLWVVDLAQFTNRYITQLADVINDTFQFELYYYGFIIKYFPQLTTECFIDYILNESELEHKYPKLAPTRSLLKTIYELEHKIIDNNYAMFPKVGSVKLKIAITQMIATVDSKITPINIRNLFDTLRCTKCLPALHAKVDYNNSIYYLHKRNILAGDIHFPNLSVFSSGLTVAISLRREDQETYHNRKTKITLTDEHNRYMFFNVQPNGKYFVRALWSEDDGYNFDDTNEIIIMFVDPIVQIINGMGRAVFTEGGKLERPTKHNIRYYSLNVSCLWRRVIPESSFKLLRQAWEPYINAGIVTLKNNQHLLQEAVFRKGMHDFDTSTIDKIFSAIGSVVNNQYAYMSVANIRAKWEQSFDGRVFKMTHRTTDVKFEVINIREDEFHIFHDYLAVYIMGIRDDPQLNVKISAADMKPLKRLRRSDPDLFNLKKYGSKKVYSVLCQNKRQPIIYNDEDIKNMSNVERNRLTKYWNFTFNRPAWYGCPDKRYPHLSFFVGYHPRGYCLPCCKKAALGEDSRKSHVTNICLRQHIYKEQGETTSRHIMNYGKEIDVGRIMKLPESLRALLFNIGDRGLYLWGVDQNLGVYEIGIAYCIMNILNMDARTLHRSIIALLTVENFTMLYGGQLPQYFTNVDDLHMAINDLFASKQSFKYAQFTGWNNLFIELAFYMGLFIICCYDNDETGINMSLYLTSYQSITMSGNYKYAICCSRGTRWYPIYEIEADAYYRNGAVYGKYFNRSHSVISTLLVAAEYVQNSNKSIIPNYQTVVQFCAGSKWQIIARHVNKRGLCYAVILEKAGKHVYFPIDYSAVEQSGTTRSIYVPSQTFAELGEFLLDYNNLSQIKITMQKLLKCGDKIVAAVDNNSMVYVISDVVPTDTPDMIIEETADPTSINNAIMYGLKGTDKREELVGKALYSTHMYHLYVLEFVNYLSQERNTELRAKIATIIDKIDVRRNLGTVQTELKEFIHNLDWTLLQSMVARLYHGEINKSELQEMINNTVFEFDRTTINKLRKDPNRKDTIMQISELVCQYVPDFDPTGLKFPNIFVSCADSKLSYCAAKKLIVNCPISELAELLASDLQDNLRLHSIIERAYINNIVDYFRFERRPNEIISIYKLYSV